MALTVDDLINKERFHRDNLLLVLLYMPFGIMLMFLRLVLVVVLWIASILLPNKWAMRQVLSTLACMTFGVYVKLKGTRDQRCSVMVANYVSCLDSLAASHVLGSITLRKWKVPPFFASTIGIRNAAQFARKQHFAECPNKPVLLQPEGGPTNGKGLLKFTDWPFQMGNRVQPVAISVSRPLCAVGAGVGPRGGWAWREWAWLLWAPLTVYSVQALAPLERHDDDDVTFAERIRAAIAQALGVETTEFRWEEVCGIRRRRPPPQLHRLAEQVKEVLPRVPLNDILRDLASTRSVDVTITNFLEGVTPYTPEPPAATSAPVATASSTPRYVTPTPTGVFPKCAKERQLSFQERKAQMIADARRRYIEKHGLNIALS